MAIANNNEEKPLIIYTFKKLCNSEQKLAAQQYIHYTSIFIQISSRVLHLLTQSSHHPSSIKSIYSK